MGLAEGEGKRLLLLFALALSSKSVRTGVAGELRLKEGLSRQRRLHLCNVFVWEGDCWTFVTSWAHIFGKILPL